MCFQLSEQRTKPALSLHDSEGAFNDTGLGQSGPSLDSHLAQSQSDLTDANAAALEISSSAASSSKCTELLKGGFWTGRDLPSDDRPFDKLQHASASSNKCMELLKGGFRTGSISFPSGDRPFDKLQYSALSKKRLKLLKGYE